MSASVSPLPPPQPLILASTSPYRRALLARLGWAFAVVAPHVDETRQPNESASALVLRLAEAKARAVVAQFPDALIIGSDQVAVLDDAVLGKPHDRATAIRQLEAAAGRCVLFHTGLCVLNAATGLAHTLVEPFRVHFRTLTRQQIENYVDREQPYDCAGSFKSEGLGITLFARLEGDDPNALMGLPLIRLTALLEAAGCAPLGT